MELIDREKVLDDMLWAMCGTGYQSDAMWVVKRADEVDPIHAMGACYCHECKFRHTGQCSTAYNKGPNDYDDYDWIIDEDYGFCSDGEKE